MMAWVTDSPNWVNNRTTSLKYRFLSSMQGGLGIGANLNKWADGDFAEAARLVASYKQVRQTVQQGDLYRLISPQNGSERSATFSVSRNRRQAVLFAFLHSSTKIDVLPKIHVAGLDPNQRYRVRAIDAAASASDPVQSGAYWMAAGIDVPMKGDFQAEGRIFEAVD
jgi:alpha-galactosidase